MYVQVSLSTIKGLKPVNVLIRPHILKVYLKAHFVSIISMERTLKSIKYKPSRHCN